MQEASTASSTFEVPEPELTPREIVARAAAMRPELLERQAETEERTFYAQETHEAFAEAGFYRILQPRRFGGYEFDLETYFRVIIEIARGCPSTGWCLCLGGAHVLQVASMFDEAGPGRLLRPRRALRVRVLRRPGRRRRAARRRLRDRREVLLRLRDPVLDALHGPDAPASRGPAGPGPHVRHLRRAVRAPRRLARRARHARQRLAQHPDRRRVDPRVAHRRARSWSTCPSRAARVGSRLHGNPMYAGRTLGFFHGEFGAIMVGSAYAALDEYQRIITTRPATWIPTMKRYELVDYQRYLGEAIARDRLRRGRGHPGRASSGWSSRAATSRRTGPSPPRTTRGWRPCRRPRCRIAWHAVEGILFRTGGSAGARDGQRMQRYWRDMSTYWSHNTPAQRDFLLTGLGRRRLGLPIVPPGPDPAAS